MGQCKLVDCCETISGFIELLSESADNTTNHYTTKSHASYLQSLKDNLSVDEMIMLLGVAENYFFVCQDAIQGYHWETSQATLHPILVNCRSETSSEIECISSCIDSDD